MLALYMRIFGITATYRVGCYIGMLFMTLFLAGSILFYCLICIPLDAEWDPTVPAICGNQLAGWQATGIINVITNAIIVSIPIPSILKLRLSTKQKVSLLIIFSFGYT
jgi:hypothetical protein